MSAPARQLAPSEPAAVVVLAGPELVRQLPRHWTGRLIERCRVSERVVQDSVHARYHGKYQLKVHQAALLLALEYHPQGTAGLLAAVVQCLDVSGSHLPTDELAKVNEASTYAAGNIGV